MTTRRRVATALAVAALMTPLSLGLAACGGGSGSSGVAAVADDTSTAGTSTSTSTTSTTSREDAQLKLSRCIRQNGVPDFPDPAADSSGNLRIDPSTLGNVDRSTLQKAFQACREYADAAGAGQISDADRTAFQDAALKFAKCMRTNGVDVPDPDFSGAGGAGPAGGLRIDRNDPDTQKALGACQEIIQSALPNGAPGGGTR